MLIFILYVILGMVGGFLSGLLGLGGGMIIVPTLSVLFAHFHIVNNSQVMHVAVGTSLAISIISLSMAAKVHYRHQAIIWKVFLLISPGVIVGSLLLGPLLLSIITGNVLKFFFAGFCIFVALQIFCKKQSAVQQHELPKPIKFILFGVLTGILSTLLGVSGGAIVGSVLNYYRLAIHKIIGTTSAICLVAAIASTLGILTFNHNQPNLPVLSTGFIYWPAFFCIALPGLITTPLGSHLAHKLSVTTLKKLFSGLLLCIGIKMLF